MYTTNIMPLIIIFIKDIGLYELFGCEDYDKNFFIRNLKQIVITTSFLVYFVLIFLAVICKFIEWK